jgi:zinc transport system ATP-binding protein
MEQEVPAVEFDHVSVAYGMELVLEDVSFQVAKGEFVGILGPNGAGKTTLLKAILGLVKPIQGTIRIFGHSRGGDGTHAIGYVPQVAHIDPNFPVHVWDVVLMGRFGRLGLFRRPARQDREIAWRALEQVGMEDLAHRQIGQLSGGQRQRVLVARALALEPELLLLDEPTAGIDTAMAESFYEFLNELHRNLALTILLVSHDVTVVSQYTDQVACLNRRLMVHGKPEEVLDRVTLECMYGQGALFFAHGDVPHMVVRRPHPGSQD